MWIEPINSDEFLRVVGPALDHASADDIARRVNERWNPRQLCQLLHHESAEVRKVACVVLGLVGDSDVIGCLTAALRDNEQQVNELAEHALWSLWFRDGSPQAQRYFKRGIAALERDEVECAVDCFHLAQVSDPHFAEAYNQCAIAHYILEQWDAAIADGRRAVRRMPTHFGALAALGHCYAQIGDLPQAADHYRRALSINPRLDVIAQALHRIESSLGSMGPSHV